MYETHWGVTRRPFENTSTADSFFRSRTHQAALLKLKYVMENNLGAAALVGPVGVGKSFISSLLPQEVNATVGPFVHVMFPQMPAADLLSWITNDLAANPDYQTASAGLSQIITAFEQQLVAANRSGRRPVIVVDDAHLIDDTAVFDALQQLMNFAAFPERQFTLILTGQPALLSRLQRVPALNERMVARSVLQPLNVSETASYIQARLATAGRQEPVFTQEAINSIFENSGGIPRRINWLCDMSLLVGFADGMTQVTENEIESITEELSSAA